MWFIFNAQYLGYSRQSINVCGLKKREWRIIRLPRVHRGNQETPLQFGWSNYSVNIESNVDWIELPQVIELDMSPKLKTENSLYMTLQLITVRKAEQESWSLAGIHRRAWKIINWIQTTIHHGRLEPERTWEIFCFSSFISQRRKIRPGRRDSDP